MRKNLMILMVMAILLNYIPVLAESSSAPQVVITPEVIAKTINGIIYQDVLIEVETSEILKNKNVTLTLVNPDADILSQDAYKDIYGAVYHSYTDSEGKCTFLFPYETSGGNHTIRVRVEGVSDVVEYPLFTISSVTEMNSLVGKLQNNQIDATALDLLFDTKGRDLGIDTSIYSRVPSVSEKICSDIIDNIETITIDEVQRLFDYYLLLNGLPVAELDLVKEIMDQYSSEIDLENKPLYSKFDGLIETDKDLILGSAFSGKTIDSIQAISEYLFKAVMLKEFKTISAYTDIEGIIADYKVSFNELASLENEITALNDDNKEKTVYAYVTDNKNSINSYEDFVAKVGEAIGKIDELIPDEDPPAILPPPVIPSNPNPPSYSGGGGGGSVVVKPIVSETPSEIVGSQQTAAVSFNDLGTVKWAEDAIKALLAKGIVSGKENSKFCPQDLVTRAEFVKMLSEAFGFTDENAQMEFSDISKEDWSYKYIAGAYGKGLVKGIDDTTFGKDVYITREDVVTLMYRFLNYTGENCNISFVKNNFSDFESVSEYAKNSVLIINNLGIVNGYEDGTFKPKNNATRAESAVMIYNVLKTIEKNQ